MIPEKVPYVAGNACESYSTCCAPPIAHRACQVLVVFNKEGSN